MTDYSVMVRLQVRPRWWLRHYLAGVALVSHLTGMEPDPEKMERWIRRGLKVVAVRVRGELEA